MGASTLWMTTIKSWCNNRDGQAAVSIAIGNRRRVVALLIIPSISTCACGRVCVCAHTCVMACVRECAHVCVCVCARARINTCVALSCERQRVHPLEIYTLLDHIFVVSKIAPINLCTIPIPWNQHHTVPNNAFVFCINLLCDNCVRSECIHALYDTLVAIVIWQCWYITPQNTLLCIFQDCHACQIC